MGFLSRIFGRKKEITVLRPQKKVNIKKKYKRKRGRPKKEKQEVQSSPLIEEYYNAVNLCTERNKTQQLANYMIVLERLSKDSRITDGERMAVDKYIETKIVKLGDEEIE